MSFGARAISFARTGRCSFDGIESAHPYPLIVGRDVTEQQLSEHLVGLGGAVEWKTELLSLEADGDGATARLKRPDGSEETVRARYIVGCEGSNSVVRKAAGLDDPAQTYAGQQYIRADAKLRWSLPRSCSHLFLTEPGYLMVVEMPGDLVRVFISLPDPEPSNRAPPTLHEVQDTLNRLVGVDADLSDPVRLSRFLTQHRRAVRFRCGPLLIAGDAAHVHVPIGGQGMNTGIQDAFNLGWKLAAVVNGEANDALLDSYSDERAEVARELIHAADRGYRAALKKGLATRKLIQLFAPYVLASDRVQERIRKGIEELDIAYPHGPLSEDHLGGKGPQAGSWVPNADVVTGDSARRPSG